MTDISQNSPSLPDIIRGTPLTLRSLRLSDAQHFSDYVSDIDIARMTGSFPRYFPCLSAEFRIMYMHAQKRRKLSFNYAITQAGHDELIGVIDLFRNAPEDMLEIGYWVAKPFWGKGYATIAGQMIMVAAKDYLGVKRLKAGVFADNPASLRVLEKLGFEKSGPVEPSFSMARLEKAPSISLRLDMDQSATYKVNPCSNPPNLSVTGL